VLSGWFAGQAIAVLSKGANDYNVAGSVSISDLAFGNWMEQLRQHIADSTK